MDESCFRVLPKLDNNAWLRELKYSYRKWLRYGCETSLSPSLLGCAADIMIPGFTTSVVRMPQALQQFAA
jgi:hypothetical protein